MEEMLSYITGVAHIGVAVPSIEEAVKLYTLLGYTPMQDDITYEQDHGVQAFMMKNGDTVIELIAPLEEGKESPVDSYIATKPYKMYHIGYYTSDFDAQVELLKKNKFLMTGAPKPSAAQGGKRTVFLVSRRLGVVELVER